MKVGWVGGCAGVGERVRVGGWVGVLGKWISWVCVIATATAKTTGLLEWT